MVLSHRGYAGRILMLMGILLVVGSCQKIGEPVPTLTQDQWQRIQEHILDEVPEIAHPVGAIFGGKIELLGYNIEPDVVETGEDFTITWYWRVLEAVEDRWEIFIHCDAGNQRQNLDHEAIDGLYTSLYWEVGQIIEDPQTVQLGHHMGQGTNSFYMGLWRRVDGARMEISSVGQGTIDADGRLMVGSFESHVRLSQYEAQRTDGPIEIDGRLSERDWRTASQSEIFVHPNDGSEVRNTRTRAKALWDNEALYIGLTATDTDIWATIEEDDGNLWEEEVLEVYLDPGGDGLNYLEIQINPRGAVFDALFAQVEGRHPAALTEREYDIEGLEAEVFVSGDIDDREDRDRRWTAEFRIPWSSLPDFDIEPAEGVSMRANFYRYDRPADEGARTVAWSAVHGGSFHQPDKFGEIILVAAPAGRGQRGRVNEGTGRGTGRGAVREQTRVLDGMGEGTGARPMLLRQRNQIRLQQPMIPHQNQPVGTGTTR